MIKTININGKEVEFKATAALPRLYRIKFHRDIFQDFRELVKDFDKTKADEKELSIPSLEIFENVAFIMAKHANPKDIPNDINRWLDEFEVFDIYQVMPELIDLWNLNNLGLSKSKKNNL